MSKLQPKIGLHSATFLVVSVIIGSGVFKKIAPMAAELGSPLLVVGCWVIAGLISLAGALSTAELVSLYPNSGGEYHYFQKIYGRFFAFLYGWSSFAVIKTAAISALAYIFAQSFNSLIPLPELADNLSIKLLASALIIVLTYINYRGIKEAELFSRLLTYAMLIGIVGLVIWGILSPVGKVEHFQAQKTLSGWTLIKALMVASLGAFWGYEGWNNIGFIGEEIEQPKRNLPIALTLGTLIVIFSYVALNLVFVYVLPIDFFISLNDSPNKIAAVEVANALGGSAGMILVALLILMTTLNATNSTILMSARILYAMARDRMFFKAAASVHPSYETPDMALVIQGVWAIALVFSGSFDQLTDMLVFASFLFYGSSALGVIIMRYREPDLPRVYRVWGYPLIPLIFVFFCAALFILTLLNQPREACFGLGLIASGIPVYLFLPKKSSD
jgi:APA family basic amino acid/polyamine antiporter